MNEFDASIMIDGQVVASKLKEFEGDLKEMVTEAWRLAFRSATFAHTEVLKQKAGLAGVLIVLKDSERHEDYERITQELNFWKAMGAAESGVPVDFEQLLTGFNKDEAVGLSKLWLDFMKEREKATSRKENDEGREDAIPAI